MVPAPKVVEIIGPWPKNKGDSLMLRAITDRLAPKVDLAASPSLQATGSPDVASLLRVKGPISMKAVRRVFSSSGPAPTARMLLRAGGLALAPQGWWRNRGIVDGKHVDVLLDCSGFGYGDQWPSDRVEQRAERFEALAARGATLVALPQAFGPFRSSEMRAAARRAFAPFDLLVARDVSSLDHLRSLQLDEDRLALAPDITHLLSGEPPADPRSWGSSVCIVPNARMLDRTPDDVADRYLDFIGYALERVRYHDLEPVLVLHEDNDDKLVEPIRRLGGSRLRIVETDAVAAKGILGACHAVVGSRFHALVGALSQGIPAVATSWAHKYPELFRGYGIEDLVVSPTDDEPRLDDALDRILETRSNASLRAALQQRAASHAEDVERMWQRVEAVAGIGGTEPTAGAGAARAERS